jgi:DNA-binding transcriptional LysR family regulator
MSWDDLRYFLELGRLKRLSHAGRKLGVDHTTVSRRVEHLERMLGCRLFESTAEGYLLTEAGRVLLAHAENIENSIALMTEDARGHAVRVSGLVRLGAPEGFGTQFLAPRLGELLADHPDLDLELLTLPQFPSLAAREADILVTLDPPQRGRYIAARLADFSYGLFASREYLRRRGAIRRTSDLARHQLIGYIDELLLSPQLRYFDELLPHHRLRLASSGMLAQVTAVRAGLGVGVLTHYLAAGTDLVPVLPGEVIFRRSFWLATHADWYRLQRVRAVWDYVRKLVASEQAFFAPQSPASTESRPPSRSKSARRRASATSASKAASA